MLDVDGRLHLDQPAEQVWRLLSDPGRVARWMPSAAQVRAFGPQRVRLQGESHRQQIRA